MGGVEASLTTGCAAHTDSLAALNRGIIALDRSIGNFHGYLRH